MKNAVPNVDGTLGLLSSKGRICALMTKFPCYTCSWRVVTDSPVLLDIRLSKSPVHRCLKEFLFRCLLRHYSLLERQRTLLLNVRGFSTYDGINGLIEIVTEYCSCNIDETWTV
ncbi:hypothetical protein RvY_12354 [Ramazzottius varieornatus]|uniref:Uncharacterized protein n=1 Tax=Ramazzottius varieornatus TaxID=947166 RepID=A0A1D1VJA3_RAMVA|nr:hypothetical protein RvY_12354 [Ramazzottius varieornatus]